MTELLLLLLYLAGLSGFMLFALAVFWLIEKVRRL